MTPRRGSAPPLSIPATRLKKTCLAQPRLGTVPGRVCEARGGGTGSALLAAALAGARELGHARMEIWSDKLLVDAHRLYERHGARVVTERVNDDPDASAERGLVLDLFG